MTPKDNKKSAQDLLLNFRKPATDAYMVRLRESLVLRKKLIHDKYFLSAYTRPLPWYPGTKLLQAKFDDELIGFGHYFLVFDTEYVDIKDLDFLDGESSIIHNFNKCYSMSLSEKDVLLYLNFFCYFAHGEEGPIRFIKTYDDLNISNTIHLMGIDFPLKDKNIKSLANSKKRLKELITDPIIKSIDDGWEVSITVQHGDSLFYATYMVNKAGSISMLNSEIIAGRLPINASINKVPSRFSFEL